MAPQPDAHSLTKSLLQDRPRLVNTLHNRPSKDLQTETIIKRLFPPMPLQFVRAMIREQQQVHLIERFIHPDSHCFQPHYLERNCKTVFACVTYALLSRD